MSRVLRHKTKEGREMPVAMMADSHLRNAIRVFSSKLGSIRKAVEKPLSPFDRALYLGDSNRAATEVAEDARMYVEKLAGFVFEATLRGMDLTTERLAIQDALGRDDRVIEEKGERIMIGLDDIWDEDDDWDEAPF